MNNSKILIVGSNGQLGKALQLKYPNAPAVDRDYFDITDWSMIERYNWSNIDIILNAAAFTNVDGAETPAGRVDAWKIDATGVGYLAKIASKHDITLVHVSSDYVFDGSRSPHPENEDVAPLGVYGQAKAAGDIAASIAPKNYILRTHALIGDGPNFVRTMMTLADKNISPTVVDDQITRLTFTHTLVEGIDYLLMSKADYGIYNLSNDGDPASWSNITRLIFKELGRNDLTVTDTTTDEYFKSKPNVSPRPLKSFFDLSKIKKAGFVPSDWRAELRNYIEAERAANK